MANPISAVWDYLRGADLQVDQQKAVAGPKSSVPLANSSTTLSSSDYGWLQQGNFQGVFSGLGDEYHGDGNSAVFACLMALAFAHIEPPQKVLRQTSPELDPTWLSASPLQALLDDPNPWHDQLELRFWTAYARHCDGNAYLRKIRAGDEITGNVIELWPISPRLMRPITLPGSRNFIDFYEYEYAAGRKEQIPTQNIVHYRIGVDDRDMRLGLSPIKRLVREIASDDEATHFADQLLHNFGIPGLVVQTPAEAPELSRDEALSLKASVAESFGNGNRGNVGVLQGGAEMRQFGFSPEQLNLEALHNVPETRIAAVMGVPPAVAGLGVGLAQTSNFASLKQVRENFTEVTLIPTWRMDAAKLNKQLKPDFTDDRTVSISHDLTNVRALQEDEDAKYKRLDEGVRSFWIRPSEARVRVGIAADPELDTLWLNRAGTPAPALGGAGGAKALERKGLETADLAATYQAIVEQLAPSLERQLDGYFDHQRRRVNRALVGG
jgi:HK97 family phage portal protein